MTDTIERRIYTWDGPDTPVFEDVAHVAHSPKSMSEVLAESPVGTIVTWKSVDAPRGHDFETLPSVKLGADSFAAHGLAAERNVFTRAELVELLQARVAPGADPAVAAARVFVTTIEIVRPD